MNSASAQDGSSSEQEDSGFFLWALLALAVGAAAITTQSLWIDETLTAVKAMQPDIAGWWQEMLVDRASDLQMPLYMLYEWSFSRIFGASEWALRAANLPWFAAGAAMFIGTFPSRKKIAPAVVALICPFAWYYLDEARPYAMQLGASLMIFAAVQRLREIEPLNAAAGGRWLAIFLFGLVALCGSSLLGMIWAGGACLVVAAIIPLPRLRELAWGHRILSACAFCWVAAIGAYYIWTLRLGARASDVGNTSVSNLAYIAYELFGFSGLGPGRLAIRYDGYKAFLPYAQALVIYGICAGDTAWTGLVNLCRGESRERLVFLGAAMLAPAVVILLAGFVEHFRVLGRHFMPLLPVLMFVLATGLKTLLARPHGFYKSLACAFVVLSLGSCLSFRFAERHGKDDYRRAAELAKEALTAGRTVWWNAGREGALYYHLSLGESDAKTNRAIWVINPREQSLANLPVPDVIITSKPDVFDGRGACAKYLVTGGYFRVVTLPAFAIWQRRGLLTGVGGHGRAEFD